MADCLWCKTRKQHPSPVVAVATAGCIHEHVGDIPLCAAHLAEMRHHDQPGCPLFCERCRHGAVPHLCDITVMRVREPAEAGRG